MPSLTLPYVPHYVAAPPSKETLEYADLAIIDISRAGTEEGRAELAIEVREALLNHGFFYVVNHGYSQDQAREFFHVVCIINGRVSSQTDRIFDIADLPFSAVSDSEKQIYAGTMKQSGSYQGYKLRQYWVRGCRVSSNMQGVFGLRKSIEFSILTLGSVTSLRTDIFLVNRDVTKREHPEALRPLLPEIKEFSKHNHFNVLHPMLRLIARSLDLPEDTLVNIHDYDAVGETFVRFMKYYPRTEEEETKTKNVWMKGHTDFGSISILWSQPVAALQILTREGKWRWIRHIENALVVNAGDALDFLTGGYYKGTIHRVVKPPEDQRNYTRLGVFYFVLSNDNVKLAPMAESPVLQRAGIQSRCDGNEALTMEQWRKARTSAYGQSELEISKETGVEQEVINGVLVKHYN